VQQPLLHEESASAPAAVTAASVILRNNFIVGVVSFALFSVDSQHQKTSWSLLQDSSSKQFT
jgi:hypothetical protein